MGDFTKLQDEFQSLLFLHTGPSPRSVLLSSYLEQVSEQTPDTLDAFTEEASRQCSDQLGEML